MISSFSVSWMGDNVHKVEVHNVQKKRPDRYDGGAILLKRHFLSHMLDTYMFLEFFIIGILVTHNFVC